MRRAGVLALLVAPCVVVACSAPERRLDARPAAASNVVDLGAPLAEEPDAATSAVASVSAAPSASTAPSTSAAPSGVAFVPGPCAKAQLELAQLQRECHCTTQDQRRFVTNDERTCVWDQAAEAASQASVAAEVVVQAKIPAGSRFEVEVRWVNRGSQPAALLFHRGSTPRFSITDASGKRLSLEGPDQCNLPAMLTMAQFAGVVLPAGGKVSVPVQLAARYTKRPPTPESESRCRETPGRPLPPGRYGLKLDDDARWRGKAPDVVFFEVIR